jgi:signal transduction histidine kinase
LNNVLKHAKATRATINLTGHANEIILLISDNGEGFDTFKERKGVGLISITNRAELYNGKVMIVSKPGKGVQLKVVLPYPKLLLESHIDL